MNTNTTRRPATEADLVIGARLYKGNGAKLVRVWSVEDFDYGRHARVTAADNPKDPSSGCLLPVKTFTVAI